MIGELEVLREQARVAAARGDYGAAAALLLKGASKTPIADKDYDEVLRPLADVLWKADDPRRALTVVEVLASNNPTEWTLAKRLLPAVPPVDRSRALAAQGHMADAAREAEAGGWTASAAFLHEKNGDWPAARTLWTRLASRSQAGTLGTRSKRGPHDGRSEGSEPATGARGERMYVSALVHFNLARCARQCEDAPQLREATLECVRLLEEAADHFESMGQRERAFDCFQVLAQIGRDNGAIEDVLEGYVNSIRILREDHLKYAALQHYRESIGVAAERGEAAAAATLAREAAEYSRSVGLEPEARRYALREAQLWRTSARLALDRGAPPEIAENALLASILAFGDVGQPARVGEVYGELAALDLRPARREHYARAARRYAGFKDEPLEGSAPAAGPDVPDGGRPRHVNEVWRVDVLEWERAGSAAEACAEVMLDARLPEFLRRRAMLARLTALEAEVRDGDGNPEAEGLRVRLAHELGHVQLYAVLSPLEHLFAQASARTERRVKVAVLEAIATLFFKRSFATVRAGLADSDPVVVGHAVKALEAFRFDHAFDPLARLVRESPNPDARGAALRALAQIETPEAAELLLGVLEHGPRVDRTVAIEALKIAKGAQFIERARHTLAASPLPGATDLHLVLREILAVRSVS